MPTSTQSPVNQDGGPSPSRNFSVGTIGAGHIAQAIAARAVASGDQVTLSNSRGPGSLFEGRTIIGSLITARLTEGVRRS